MPMRSLTRQADTRFAFAAPVDGLSEAECLIIQTGNVLSWLDADPRYVQGGWWRDRARPDMFHKCLGGALVAGSKVQGRPSQTFASSYLDLSSQVTMPTGGSGSFTLVSVAVPTTISAVHGTLCGTLNDHQFGIGYWRTGGVNKAIGFGDGDVAVDTSGSVIAPQIPSILMGCYDAPNTTLRLYVQGSLADTQTGVAVSADPTMLVGAVGSPAASNYFAGHLAETLILNVDLHADATKRGYVTDYLKAKYSLA